MDFRKLFLLFTPVLATACVMTPEEPVREVTFLCERGTSIEVGFGTDSAMLRGSGVDVTLAEQPTGSGFRYAGSGHELRGKGHEVQWTRPTGEVQTCRDEEWAMKQPQIQPPIASLDGTRWALAYFESSDDTIGRIIPDRLDRYTMSFAADGSVALQLDCNRGQSRWSAEPTSASGGGITFSPGAMTRAMCPEGSMDTRIAADLARVRTYTLRNGMLHLALEMDSGIYAWRSLPAAGNQ